MKNDVKRKATNKQPNKVPQNQKKPSDHVDSGRTKVSKSKQHKTKHKSNSSSSFLLLTVAVIMLFTLCLLLYIFLKPQLSQSKVESGMPHASLFQPFSLDPEQVQQIRRKNMKKYDYNYSTTGIDKRSNLSLQEFWDIYDGKWPVIITDVIPKWNAHNWTKEFFYKNYGKDRVTMKAVQNSLGKAVSLALPLELFVKNVHKASPTEWTYIEDELFLPMRPHLKKDIGECIYLKEDYYQLFPEEVRPWNAMLLWGTQFSRSSLHIDPYNWTGTNAVFQGKKRWKMYPPVQDNHLHVMHDKNSGFPLDCFKYNSPVDTYDLDTRKYPLFSQAKAIEFDQGPGEMLIIPTGWFHQAYNVEETIAISSQVMNRNNYRVVLEEILKIGTISRQSLPSNIDKKSPEEQVQVIMSMLPEAVLQRGRAVTADILRQISDTKKNPQHHHIEL